MKKHILLNLIILLFVFLSFNLAQATEFPSTIKVGLYFENTARQSYQLSSLSGFEIGFKQNEFFETLLHLPDKTLDIYKVESDQFYPLVKDLSNKQEAIEILEQYTESGKKDLFVFYNGNWAVWEKTDDGVHKSDTNLVAVEGLSNTSKFVFPLETDEILYFKPCDEEDIIALNGAKYRGVLEFIPSGSEKITAINELELDKYLYGVVPKEMPASWPIEALKAQAVAARTYAVSNLSKWMKYGFDVTCDTRDQAYGGYEAENIRTNEAVDATKGQIALYEGEPILALYHSDSGGVTADCEEVFGDDLPYLKSVKELFDTGSPHSTWKVSLDTYFSEQGRIENIDILEKSTSGRVKKLMISGSSGEQVLSSSEIRNVLQLKSTLFDISGNRSLAQAYVISSNDAKKISLDNPWILTGSEITNKSNGVYYLAGSSDYKIIENEVSGEYFLEGRGWGHGVGMSQWGAKAMAENGYNYTDILQHYYTNIEIR